MRVGDETKLDVESQILKRLESMHVTLRLIGFVLYVIMLLLFLELD